MVSSTLFRLFVALNIGLSASTVLASDLSARACKRTVKAKQGDTCATIASAQGITVADFLVDNPTVSSCDLTAGTDYCVAQDATTSSASASPTPSLVISSDGSCGNGVTCAGSQFGACCSEHGYCGNGDAYCSAGCQALYGSCGAVSSSSSSPGGPTTQPASGSGTVWVTATTVVTRTSVTSSTKITTIAVPGTVTGTVTSTAVVTVTSTVRATQTSLVLSTSLVTRTATSIVAGTVTATVTVTAVRTATTVAVVTGACSPTKPDTPITITRSSTRSPTPTASLSPPSPLFPGTVSNCKKYYQVRPGDDCDSIVGSNGITFAQFYRWNPSVSCDDLWQDYYLCISA